jgi:hypothetical protein
VCYGREKVYESAIAPFLYRGKIGRAGMRIISL